MEDYEIPWKLNSISFLVCIGNMEQHPFKSFPCLSTLSSHPLFSCIITLYILILLYFPPFFFRLIFSPLLIITGFIFFYLLRIGAAQTLEMEEKTESKRREAETVHFSPNSEFEENFVEWNVGAPLDVIYEGDEENEGKWNLIDLNIKATEIERYPSLSMYYPESDSDSDSSFDWDFASGGFSFKWEDDDDDKEELIEIALDLDFHGEEENLIEIDLSPLI